MSDPRDHASWLGYGYDPEPQPSSCGVCLTIGLCVGLGLFALAKLLGVM